ncbi:MAG: outer membrane lipoprotein chaperone LolA [Aquabacterium sp.]|nr:outer membrane lipoprotein chaperone LolA [Aquabacterium sp.]
MLSTPLPRPAGPRLRTIALTVLTAAATLASPIARADAVQSLKRFVSEVRSGRASFTQTVTQPDGKVKKPAQGQFEFQRPNRFRFSYTAPYQQLIVGDGQKVWLLDSDLNQVTVRPMSEALGATPAALLAGGSLDKDFELRALPDQAGLEWAEARPRIKDGPFQTVKVGFKGGTLAALEILDSFGQRSRLDFQKLEPNAAVGADRFRFQVPPGADVIEQ